MKDRINAAFCKTALTAFFIVSLALAAPVRVQAHARLVRSVPAFNSELAQPPSQIELWYNELLDNGFNSITVYPATEESAKTHDNLAAGGAQVDPNDRTHLTIGLKALEPGEYVVEWRVLSQDGHSAPGKFKFKIRAAR